MLWMFAIEWSILKMQCIALVVNLWKHIKAFCYIIVDGKEQFPMHMSDVTVLQT